MKNLNTFEEFLNEASRNKRGNNKINFLKDSTSEVDHTRLVKWMGKNIDSNKYYFEKSKTVGYWILDVEKLSERELKDLLGYLESEKYKFGTQIWLPAYESINEARAIKVELTPDLFSETSVWGIYKDQKMTGCACWKWNSNLLSDMNPEGSIPGEQDVVFVEVSIFSTGKGYAKVGITNHLKREPSTTYGMNYSFTAEDAKKNLKKISKEAADFLMDDEHFKFINKNITSNRQKLILKLKGDFSEVYEKVISEALKDKP